MSSAMPLLVLGIFFAQIARAAPPASSPAPAAASSGGRLLRYEGRLQDAKNRPLGGVFALTFGLYNGPKGGKPVWSESHFVAVDGGSYEVELGRQRALGAANVSERTFVSVSVTGGAELVRERVDPKAVSPSEPWVAPTPPPSLPDRPLPEAGRTVVDYAENAGLALQAETAKRADRLGKLSEEDIRELLSKVGPKLDRRDPQHSEKAGGPAGKPYELLCPKGHVLTGIRGGSGQFVDSLQLICTKLE